MYNIIRKPVDCHVVTKITVKAAVPAFPNQLILANASTCKILARFGMAPVKIKDHTKETITPLIILGIKNKERITPLHRTFESKKYAITKPIKFDIKIDITAKIKVNTTE